MKGFNRNLVRAAGVAAVVAAAGEAAAIAPPWQWQWIHGAAATEETIRCTIQTKDGGYASVGFRAGAAGGPRDILVIRSDSSGAVVWQRVYDGGGDDEGHTIIETDDGGFALAGDTTSAGPLESFVLKLSPLGTLAWGRVYPGNAGGPAPGNTRLIEMRNREIVVAGRAADITIAGNQLPMLARMTAGGAPMWSFAYIDARYGPTMFGGFADVVERPVPGNPSEIVPVGFTSPAPGALRQMFVMDIASVGGPIAAGVYFSAGVDSYANSVTMAPGDEIAFAGRFTPVGGAQQTAFVRTNPALAPIAGQMYRDVLVSHGSLWSLDAALGVDEFIIGGSVPQSQGSAALDLWLSRLGGGGAGLWAMQYGGSANDRGHSSGISADGLTIAGEEHSFAGAAGNGYIVKTGPGGRSGCNEAPFDLAHGQTPVPWLPIATTLVAVPTQAWLPERVTVDVPARNLCSRCPADLNDDGLVDFSDYLEFLNLYDAGDLRADYNGDGLIDFSDYLEFLNYYDTCA